MMATRVYIGRLARDARERDIEKLFRNYGTIREIKLMNGFGFVEFRDHRDADDVVYAFNGKSFMGEKYELLVHYENYCLKYTLKNFMCVYFFLK
jgi:arginine/serine-rich splicing factor 4/5/6